MDNADKNQHGSSFQQSIEYFIIDLCGEKGIRSLSRNKRLGYDGYDPKQFYIAYEISFQDDTKWAAYTTTSMRDRFKGQLWDAYNVKQIDEQIEAALLVYPDSISDEEKKAFQSKSNAIENEEYYSYIDYVVSESKFQAMLEEKAMDSAGLSSGVKGDHRGKRFEQLVVTTMENQGNLDIYKGASVNRETGYSFDLFKLIIEAKMINPEQVQTIHATRDIPLLPSGGNGKTDVIVYYKMADGTTVDQKISCKRTLADKVSVNQYPAKEIIRILKIPEQSELAKAICIHEECGSGKAIRDKYGSSGLEFVRSSIENSLTQKQLRTLTKWVISGYGADSPDINCSDWILIRKGTSAELIDSIFSVEEYVDTLLNEEPLQMGTPFEWTFASGQRGKSIQFKMKTSH